MAVKTSRPAPAGHTAGIFADMSLDGPEIGTLVVVVDRAKNLPNRKTMGKQDPYCAMRLGKEAKKTDTDRRGGQTPKWDQELRFTVHEAPDYYKLKVSIFNDDKRTDLIGEAFVSLTDLIKPGGGSNDLWHQLNYKGKYAGEVRIEMTYYDNRPREEKHSEKRRHRERNTLGGAEQRPSTTDISGPRKLGPREVRRRPVQDNSSQAAWPVEIIGQTTSTSTDHALQPDRPTRQLRIQNDMEAYRDDAADFQLPPPDLSDHRRRSYAYEGAGVPDQGYGMDHPVLQQDFLPQQLRTSTNSSRSLPVTAMYEPYDEQPLDWDVSQRRRSHQSGSRHAVIDNYHGASAYSEPVGISKLAASTTDMALQQSDLQYPPHHAHQSRTNYEDSHYLPDETDFDEVPPPPPKHSHAPRGPQVSYPPSSYVPQPLRPTPIRPFVQDRSPLQQIEHGFGPPPSNMPQSQPYPITENPSDARWTSGGVFSEPKHEHASQPGVLGTMQDSHYDSQHPYQYEESLGLREHHEHQNAVHVSPHTERTSEIRTPQQHHHPEPLRSNIIQTTSSAPPLPNRPRSYEDQLPHSQAAKQDGEHYSSGAYSQSMSALPQVVADVAQRATRAEHRKSMQTPARKPVSPGPYPEEAGGRRLSGIPFGPDAYDVLNPASSPVTNENTPFETQEQAQWSGRLRDVRRAQDLGPIIDNDGRVIDPSDHLPTSSWAPEPERKQRRPEHVIHYRTKNDGNVSRTTGSSPASARTSMGRSLPSSPMTAPVGSSASQGLTLFTVNKNTYHQTMPATNRPLPTVPYPQQPQPVSTQGGHHQQTTKRSSYHEAFVPVHRPSLSEYQVPVQNQYSTPLRHSQEHQTPQQPPSTSSITSRCQPVGYGDSLAAEMSMIDIGPSRQAGPAVRYTPGY